MYFWEVFVRQSVSCLIIWGCHTFPCHPHAFSNPASIITFLPSLLLSFKVHICTTKDRGGGSKMEILCWWKGIWDRVNFFIRQTKGAKTLKVCISKPCSRCYWLRRDELNVNCVESFPVMICIQSLNPNRYFGNGESPFHWRFMWFIMFKFASLQKQNGALPPKRGALLITPHEIRAGTGDPDGRWMGKWVPNGAITPRMQWGCNLRARRFTTLALTNFSNRSR